jgi:hypothetical protein
MPCSTGRTHHIAPAKPHRPIAPDRHRAFPRPARFQQMPADPARDAFGSLSRLGPGPHRDLLLDQLGPERIQPILYRSFDLGKRGARVLMTPAFHFLKDFCS